MTAHSNERGRVIQTWKDGIRILWTFVPEMPDQEIRSTMPWLTVVRWEYDGSGNKGMPGAPDNQHMLMLEAILAKIERPAFCHEGYRRIGAGVREFVYYIANQDKFLQEFNCHAVSNPRCPITIKFYRDETWSDLQDLINELVSCHSST